MLDVFLFITFMNIWFFGAHSFFVKTGFPLALLLLGLSYYIHILPPEMYTHGPPQISSIVLMMISIDLIQFVSHVLEHRMHLKSHSRHHIHTDPQTINAFETGWVDAILGLMVPLLISLWLTRPNKTSAALFGGGYAMWLQFIHSNHPRALQFGSSILVSPRYHRLHHKHPQQNFGHIFVIWDWLYGTARFF